MPGGLPAFIKQAVKRAKSTEHEMREQAAMHLFQLALQGHGEHCAAIHDAGAVTPLVNILRDGGAKSQSSACGALGAIAASKDVHQTTIADAGGIPPVVRLLKTGSAKVQEQAASTLASLNSDASHQKQVLAAGGIVSLVAMLKGGSAAAQAHAAQALANAAAYGAAGQNAIATAGAVPILLSLLGTGKAQMPAAAALGKLAHANATIQIMIMNAGGITPLLALLNGLDVSAQVQASAALAEMCCDNMEVQAAVAKAGGIGPLLALLASRSGAAQASSMAAIAQLAHANRDNQDAIARMGGLKPLVALLGHEEPNVQAHAALALMEITRANKSNQDAVVKSAGISQLATLMKQSQHAAVKAEVAGAFWSLSEDPGIKADIAHESTIQPLVLLLGNGDDRGYNHAARALASLGLDNEGNQVQITEKLLELLGTGTEEAQSRAVSSLQALVADNPSAHDTIAQAGNPEALVDLLKGSNPDAKNFALWSLSLSISVENQERVASADGIKPLIDLLSDERMLIREQAAAAIGKLAFDNSDTRTKITQAGGVKPLMALLDPNQQSEMVLKNASMSLSELAGEVEARDEVVAEGGVRSLVQSLSGDGETDALRQQTKTYASRALARMSKEHVETQSVVAKAGAIRPLVTLLNGTEGVSAQEEAAGALYALSDHEPSRDEITKSDGIGWLVSLLGCDNPRAREHAEGALVRLSIENANRVLIINKLVDMLQASGTAAQEQAAAALANLARESEDNRKSIVEADGIPPLLALLDSSSAKAKENSVGAIKELCRKSKENQLSIAKVGGIPKLVGVLLGFTGTTMKDPSVVSLCTLAASAIKEMAKGDGNKGNRRNQDAIAEAGAITPLVAMLGAHTAAPQANAAGALANLARNHTENQAAIAKTGAIAPLCTLVREGSPETKDASASAIWALATDNAPNKDTIAKLGGIDPLIGLLVSGTTEKSQECVAGGLAALASRHPDNRQLIVKRLVGLLSSSAAKKVETAVRVLQTCSLFMGDSTANQVMVAKAGGIPPLITWVQHSSELAKTNAANAMLCLVADNTTTQVHVAKANGIGPLIALVKRSPLAAQEYAARALWHLASQQENQLAIAYGDSLQYTPKAGAIVPLVAMLAAEGESAPELAAVILVRLTKASHDVSIAIAKAGGIPPLVKLVSNGSPGASQQSAAALAEIALVCRNRDQVANAAGIPPLIRLLSSTTMGTAETAARALSHIARDDDEEEKARKKAEREYALKYGERVFDDEESNRKGISGPAERRATIDLEGGIKHLIVMLEGKVTQSKPLVGLGLSKHEGGEIGAPGETPQTRMQEQAAAALGDIALFNADMQDAIIQAGGVPPLLSFIRTGTVLGQEYSARAIWHLCELALPGNPGESDIQNQSIVVECGAIKDLVGLLKTGGANAQEVAAAGLSDIARGGIVERRGREEEQRKRGLKVRRRSIDMAMAPIEKSSRDSTPPGQRTSKKADEEEDNEGDENDRLCMIADAGGITPLVKLLDQSSTTQARENAAGALWHLALDIANQIAIAKANGISPLVTILDDGTVRGHEFAALALKRLAVNNSENQAQIAKHVVALLGNPSPGPQKRAAHALMELGKNPGAPVIIVNAGAISPLVMLLSAGVAEVKEEAAGALSTLALNSPSTQLAIATGLVGLVGAGAADAQEHVTQLLLKLAADPDNCKAIAKSGAISRLVVQLRGGGQTSIRGQELAAQVLSYLSADSDDNVATIASASGIRPLINLLSFDSPVAQANSAAVLSDLARVSKRSKGTIISEGGIALLVTMLMKPQNVTKNAKQLLTAAAEAAGALHSLTSGEADTKKTVADAGAIQPLVSLLSEDHNMARKKAAGAISALSDCSQQNQDHVAEYGGISKLVDLLNQGVSDEVRAQAAAALAVLSRDNKKNQDNITAAGGILPLVALLKEETVSEFAKEEAASALWSLATKHYENQVAVAKADGIAALVLVLGMGSKRAQEHAANALAALALENSENELSIAQLVVKLLGSEEKTTSAKAALAISSLARAHPKNQASIAKAGGVNLLVSLLDAEAGGVGQNLMMGLASKEALEAARVQKEMAGAIWSLTLSNPENQLAIAEAGGIPPLILLLEGHVEVHRDVAGALWSLADKEPVNQMAVANSGGIAPLVNLAKNGSKGAQETAAGALHALAEAYENRISIAESGGIAPLVALFDGGSDMAIEQAAGAMLTLVVQNVPNQTAISTEAVAMLKSGTVTAQEHVTQLVRNLAKDPENRGPIAKAGAVPELVRQLESGSKKAMSLAASGLALIALKSAEHRANVTQELVKLLASDDEAVRQRASEALRNMAADEKPGQRKQQSSSSKAGGSATQSAGLVNLLKDGLKDGRVEAQEYALWSLSQITDTASRESIVDSGAIQPLIKSLQGGKLSAVALEHAAMVLSGLAPLGENAIAIKSAGGIDPLVGLLSVGNTDAKEHAAGALAQLALRAGASLDIAKAGAVSAFVRWLVDPSLGPPEVAASALSEIALDNFDTQSQIAEEGAIAPLVGMLSAAREAQEARMQMKSQYNAIMAASTASKDQDPAEVEGFGGELIQAPATPLTPAAAQDPLVAAGSASDPAAVDGPLPSGAQVGTDSQGADASVAPDVPFQPPQGRALRRSSVSMSHMVTLSAVSVVHDNIGRSSSPTFGKAPKTATEIKARKLSRMAAGALATLANNHAVNQITVTEEGGIPSLVDLLDESFPICHENATNALWHLAANDDNQTAIARAGGIPLLVKLLNSDALIVQQYTAAAIEALARENTENQIALAKAGAIEPLVGLLGSEIVETQEHSVGALLHLASHDEESRNAVVKKLVAVLDIRMAAAQMKSAEALAVLAARSSENRKAITAADAIEPLVRLLGDGRRTRSETPQERAAAVLADLAKSGENKTTIVGAGGVNPLVAMLSSESPEAQTHAAGALWQLAALGSNKKTIADSGAIPPLVALLKEGLTDAQRFATGALWHLASSADNKIAMVTAGAIPPLVKALEAKNAEAREHAAAVISTFAREKEAVVKEGGTKKSIVAAGGIKPLIHLLSEKSIATQKHAACALWGLATDGHKESIYNEKIVRENAIAPLIIVLLTDNPETRGFAAACLCCLCKDERARQAMVEAGGSEPLLALAHGNRTWLRNQAIEMLNLLGIPLGDPEDYADTVAPLASPGPFGAPQDGGKGYGGMTNRTAVTQSSSRTSGGRTARTARSTIDTARSTNSIQTKIKFHVFSFQTGQRTNFKTNKDIY